MANFPPEIITDILSRLPAKSLLRFRCVSKPWCSLTKSPDFIELHLNRSLKTNTNLSLILRDSYLYSIDFDSLNTAIKLNHPLLSDRCGTDILGACNGLLALCNGEENIVLWNPSTRKCHRIPESEIEFPSTPYFTSCEFIIYGFGHDPVSDDYKLVRMVQFYGRGGDSEVKVYSMKINSWKRIRDFPYYLRYKRAYGKLAGNSLHFVVCELHELVSESDSESDESHTSPSLIVAFDLQTEDYLVVPQPDYLDQNCHMNVDVLDGCLCLLCNYINVRVDVHVMKEYGVKESWTKMYSVAQPEMIRSFEFVIPMAHSKDGKKLLLIQDGDKFVWYDLKRRRVEDVRIDGFNRSKYVKGGLEAYMSVESLVALGDNRPTFPPETITNILCRLPVKSLLRFRCVSKPWCSLTKSPDFIKLHLSHSLKTNTNLSLILRDSYLYSIDFDSLNTAVKLNHPLLSDSCGTEILGACNGLLALYNGEEDIVLWNPSTRKCHRIPESEIEFPPYFTCCQFIIYGFGHDPVSDDYKLVRMVQFYGRGGDESFDSEVKVYSMKTKSWKRIRDFPYYLRYKRAYGKLAGNSLHFVVSGKTGVHEFDTESDEYDSESDESYSTPSLIVAFDLRTEDYLVVPHPDYLDQNCHMNVDVLDACLCILCNYINVRVDVWVMKEYGVEESWTKMYSVAQPEVIRSFEFVIPMAHSKDGKKLLLIQDGDKFVWYDLKKRRVEVVRINSFNRSKYVKGGLEAYMCVESLVALGDNRPINRKKQQASKGKKKKNTRKKNQRNSDDFLSHGFKLVL